MWGPKFNHGIPLFYPEAILAYYNISPVNPYYVVLIVRVTAIIELEVMIAASKLNGLVRAAFQKDLLDIDEYTTLPEYSIVLESALSSPVHVGVEWGKKLVQAKFIDTDALGGLAELIEIQHEAYPSSGPSNLGAWVSLYRRWLEGSNDSIGDTLRKRLSIMGSMGIAPFAELIETGNDMYPAYPSHSGKHTLRDFKPTYNREMRIAFQKVMVEAKSLLFTLPPTPLIPDIVESNGLTKQGFTWKAKSGNTIFVLANSVKMMGNRFVGSGFILSQSGNIIKKWYGFVPK